MKIKRKVTLSNMLPQSRMFDAYKRMHNTGLFYQMTSIGHAFFTTDHSISRAAREYCSYALLYIVKGGIELNFNGVKTICPERHVVIIDCYREHFYKSISDDNEVYYIHFEGSNSNIFYSTIANQRGNCFAIDKFDEHVDELAKWVNIVDTDGELVLKDLSKTIYCMLSDCVEMDYNKAQSYSHIVKQIKSYIDTHYNTNIRLSQFYHDIFISSQYAIKIFKAELGITPYQYMLDLKLNDALKEIMECDDSIEEIATRLGFSSSSNFNKLFKSKFNLNPSHFRKYQE